MTTVTPSLILQPRDREVLASLGENGVMDTEMLHAHHFQDVSHRRCRQRLWLYQQQAFGSVDRRKRRENKGLSSSVAPKVATDVVENGCERLITVAETDPELALPIKANSFSDALAMIASLPLSDAEKAEAVRRLMAEQVG